jgi:hypothetical protein
LEKNLSGAATLESHEPDLKVIVTPTDRLGHVGFSVEITPDHMTQDHRFDFDADQTFLSPIVKQCEGVLDRFPIRMPLERGV